MILTLTRDATQPANYCTLGRLDVGGLASFYTVERPWVPHPGAVCGEQGKSCIGAGTYVLEPRHTEAKDDHWSISNPDLGVYRFPDDVPEGAYARSLILIHAANWAHELLGCIAPGKSRAIMDGEWGVSNSQATMAELRVLMGHVLDLQLIIQ